MLIFVFFHKIYEFFNVRAFSGSITKKSKPIEVGKGGQHPFNSATDHFFSCVITDEPGWTIKCMVHKDKWDDLKYVYKICFSLFITRVWISELKLNFNIVNNNIYSI